MKITVPVFSRNRPCGLLSVLTAMDALATGQNEIHYPLIVDEDDSRTLVQLDAWQLPPNTHPLIGKRDRVLNARMNEAADLYPADAYFFCPDDGYPLEQHWDRIFMAAHAQGLPAWCWQEKNDPGNPTFICVSQRWIDALGHVFPEYFPYWFADTWIAEVHLIAFGTPIPIVNQLGMGGKRGTTQGMRDLEFWFRFFAHTRDERVEEARKLARASGFTLHMHERQHFIDQLEANDARQLAAVGKYEVDFAANAEPASETYLAAKARAEEMMDRRIVVLQ